MTAVPGTVSKSTKLSYRAWLFMQHAEQTEFKDFARLVLAGGPDNMWVGKGLEPDQVCREVEHLYASKRSVVRDYHVEQARAAIVAYKDDKKSVDKLIEERDDLEKASREELEGVVSEALVEAEKEHGVEIVRGSDKTEPPSSEKIAAGGLLRTVCAWVNGRTGRKCSRIAVTGQAVCDIHGGMYLEPEEMREILKRGQEKMLAVSGQAIDAIVDVMENSTNDMVRLKGAELILDRAGFRPKTDAEAMAGASQAQKPTQGPAVIIRERLHNLGKHDRDDEAAAQQRETIVHVITDKDENQ